VLAVLLWLPICCCCCYVTVLHCHGLSSFYHDYSVTWCGLTTNLHFMRWYKVSTYSTIQFCVSECKNLFYTLRQTTKTSYPGWSFSWSCSRQSQSSTLSYAIHPSLLFKLSLLLFSAFFSANASIVYI